jgi:hypothetical protein
MLQLAAVFPDLLACVLVVGGIEHIRISPGITAFSWLDGYDLAISHSLLMDVLWSALFAALYLLRRRDARGAGVLFALVLSHWLLDYVTHRPELHLVPGAEARLGLGLWNSIPATFAVEGGLWAICLAVYIRSTAPTTPLGTYALYALVVLLTLGFIAIPFAPPPSTVLFAAVAGGVAIASILGWSHWIEKLRTPRSIEPTGAAVSVR